MKKTFQLVYHRSNPDSWHNCSLRNARKLDDVVVGKVGCSFNLHNALDVDSENGHKLQFS